MKDEEIINKEYWRLTQLKKSLEILKSNESGTITRTEIDDMKRNIQITKLCYNDGLEEGKRKTIQSIRDKLKRDVFIPQRLSENYCGNGSYWIIPDCDVKELLSQLDDVSLNNSSPDIKPSNSVREDTPDNGTKQGSTSQLITRMSNGKPISLGLNHSPKGDLDKKCYIGIKPCGCVTALMIKNNYKDEEDELEEWKEQGLKINIVSLEEGRKRLRVCKCKETSNTCKNCGKTEEEHLSGWGKTKYYCSYRKPKKHFEKLEVCSCGHNKESHENGIGKCRVKGRNKEDWNKQCPCEKFQPIETKLSEDEK